VRLAYYPEAVYLILSIESEIANPLMKGFRILQGEIMEVPFSLE
jgi:hypothetical protein